MMEVGLAQKLVHKHTHRYWISMGEGDTNDRQ